MQINTSQSDGVKTIIITGNNNDQMKLLEVTIGNIVAMANFANNESQEKPHARNINKVRPQGRPRTSCFGADGVEKANRFVKALKQFLDENAQIKGEWITVEDETMTQSAFGAMLSCELIDRYANQKDFCRVLQEGGLRVEYNSMMRALVNRNKKKEKPKINMDYFNSFY